VRVRGRDEACGVRERLRACIRWSVCVCVCDRAKESVYVLERALVCERACVFFVREIECVCVFADQRITNKESN
jgi:hypothetical protein